MPDPPGSACRRTLALVTTNTAVRVQVSSLTFGESPRFDGEHADQIDALAASIDTPPPILVHRLTMRIIDGRHRVRAAILRGDLTIMAQFFDGDDSLIFVAAVEANVRHGLPLTLAERKTAASRIIGQHPDWSDRSIAAIAGISASTTAAVRRSRADQAASPEARTGLDGRARPINIAEGRRRAARIIEENPNLPLREVARLSGVSLGTAHAVCRQLGTEAAGPPKPPARRSRPRGASTREWSLVRQGLIQDPSVRLSATGRRLVKWFDRYAFKDGSIDTLLGCVPPHWSDTIAELALQHSEAWRKVAEQLSEGGLKEVRPAERA